MTNREEIAKEIMCELCDNVKCNNCVLNIYKDEIYLKIADYFIAEQRKLLEEIKNYGLNKKTLDCKMTIGAEMIYFINKKLKELD